MLDVVHVNEIKGDAAVTAHLLDIGGSFPGINADAFDVYAEGTVNVPLPLENGVLVNADLDNQPARLGVVQAANAPSSQPVATQASTLHSCQVSSLRHSQHKVCWSQSIRN